MPKLNIAMKEFKKYISDKNRKLSIICHRGLWGPEPENSISSIKSAIENKFHIVEVDVRRNIDGDFFLMHDENFQRTTNIHGKITEISSSNIKEAYLKMSNGGDNKLSEERIPLLKDVLRKFKGKVLFDLDVKNSSDRASLISFINNNDFHEFVDVKIPILSIDEAKNFVDAERDSKIIKMIVLNVINQTIEEITSIIEITNPSILEVNFNDNNIFLKILKICNDKNIAVWVNTLDDVPNGGYTDSLALRSPDQCWGHLLNLGVSMIQTDHPRRLMKWYNH